MMPGMLDRVPAPWCKPGGAKHGSGSVLQPCFRLAERHHASLLTHMLLAFLATLQAPEDTGDTRGGLTSACIRHNIGGQSTHVSVGSRKWVNLPLCSGVLMELLFHRVSGSVLQVFQGKKKKEKKNLYSYFFSSEAGQSVKEGTFLCLVPAQSAR